jgi:hypothetical protein
LTNLQSSWKLKDLCFASSSRSIGRTRRTQIFDKDCRFCWFTCYSFRIGFSHPRSSSIFVNLVTPNNAKLLWPLTLPTCWMWTCPLGSTQSEVVLLQFNRRVTGSASNHPCINPLECFLKANHHRMGSAARSQNIP